MPLEGIRIIDVTQALAGPFCAMILGDLGAEIIKVERPTGDLTRSTPPHYIDGTSLYFLTSNRNKKSIAVDLKTSAGRKILHDLVRIGDVVVYNYTPKVASRLAMDHETLVKINPRIITCSITGFGKTGEKADRPLVDVVAQSLAGAMSITGEENRPPVRAGFATADLSAGLYACIGILAALQGRATTGENVKVETSLFHSQLSLLNYHASFTRHTKTPTKRLGSAHAGHAVHGAFRTKDGWITIEAAFDRHFQALCGAMGAPEMASDPRFESDRTRNQHRIVLLKKLDEIFLTRTTAEWYQVLDEAGVPVGPVNSVLEALEHPQVREYSALRAIPFGGAMIEALATPLWFNDRIEHPVSSPPNLGEHTTSILSGLLNYPVEKIAALRSSNIVVQSPSE
jgi:crotonobetainyl-CoA:carnitine CoA-transferase CaiB-like acyl-CoA transferase